jgi:hypothetical protein
MRTTEAWQSGFQIRSSWKMLAERQTAACISLNKSNMRREFTAPHIQSAWITTEKEPWRA